VLRVVLRVMVTFSANEDKSLILLVVMFESASGEIDWKTILQHLQPTSKTIEEYKDRLLYLKQTDTSILRDLPASFLAGSSLERPLTHQEVYVAIDEIFSDFTAADVRQPRGLRHFNAGEIAPIGVTLIIEATDPHANDVFVDVGSGTGSVLAQIVLQTSVSNVIGVEIREDLAQKS
jgi:Histone methylation protein DOT1